MRSSARVSLVTLGVADVVRSTAFYEALGWPLSSYSVPGEVSFFNTAGGILAVWNYRALAEDAGLPAPDQMPAGFRAAANAINLDSPADVDSLIAKAVAAGATITRAAKATDWGGYNGYFADPDGHLWEVAHNPDWPIGADGRPQLP